MMWLFKKRKNGSKVDNIIKLMEHRPTEWTFTNKESRGISSYFQYAEHPETKLKLRLQYHRENDNTPTTIRFWHSGSHATIEGREKKLLLNALHELQHSRFNKLAAQHLKVEYKVDCCKCENKILGWAWVCKCQATMHQECYSEANVCPDCGGTLVDAILL